MNGLELARRYYTEVARPAFEKELPGLMPELAWGLAGPGSECYGFDDEISRDHDWGPRICIWVRESTYRREGDRLQQVYDKLDATFLGFGPVRRLDTRVKRDGVMSVEGFYQTHLGTAEPPVTLRDWLLLPEEALSLCTNGEVFADPHGEFTRIRTALAAYFPRDLWLKKIASRCKAAARHGQYDQWRARRREDAVTAAYHAARFAREVAALAFLLDRTYRPVEKWLFAGLLRLAAPGPQLHRELEQLVRADDEAGLGRAVEQCCAVLIDRMVNLEVVEREGSFLWDYGTQIEQRIEAEILREGLDSVE